MIHISRANLEAFVLPLTAVVIPAVLVWARDLNTQARRMRSLDEQSKVLTFWEKWTKLLESTTPCDRRGPDWSFVELDINDLKREARREMAEAGRRTLKLYRKSFLDEAMEFPLTHQEFQKYRASLPWYRRAILLYKAANPSARTFKRLFHFYLVGPVLFVLAEVAAQFLHTNTLAFLRISFLQHVHLKFDREDIIALIITWGLAFFYPRQTVITLEKDPSEYILTDSLVSQVQDAQELAEPTPP